MRTADAIPVPVSLSFYTDSDKALARILCGWRALTVEQYRYLSEQLNGLPGKKRIPELCKRGFIVRHELLDADGKRLYVYYLPGPVAARLCGLPYPPALDLISTVSVLMCNQLIIAGLTTRWEVRRIFDLGVGRIPCWLTRLGQSYGVLPLLGHQHEAVMTMARATRGLLIVPDVAAALSFAQVTPIPVRYLLWPDLLQWQISVYKVEAGQIVPASISFSNTARTTASERC